MRQPALAALLFVITAMVASCGFDRETSSKSPAGNVAANARSPAACEFFSRDAFITRQELAAGSRSNNANLMLRFLHYTDDHILDDEGQTINGAAFTDPIYPIFESAQRLQEEYSDEVLNNLIGLTNDCLKRYPAEFMIVTGDSADLTTVAEARRFIDNLDGTFDQLSAFEKNCVAALPAGTPAPVIDQACTRFTGRGVPDSQSEDPNVDDPSFQFTLTRTVRQLLNQFAAQMGRAADGSLDPSRQTLTRSPGLPAELRCNEGEKDCPNQALKTPWYIAFGNHDGYLRGTAAVGAGINELSFLTSGRHHMNQREFINEFFETRSQPKGHGFNLADAARRSDADPRNDGYYAFNAGAGKFRMIVLNTIIDGTDPRLPTDLIRNPLALSDGTVDAAQFAWLQAQLKQAWSAKQLVMVFSHHPDLTFAEFGLFAQAVPTDVTAAQVNAELASFPNVLAWVAGHTHLHRVRAFEVKPAADGLAGSNGVVTTPVSCRQTGKASDGRSYCRGFWQIETASLIDFPQEQRLIEVFDNGNGTGTLRGPVLTHRYEKSRKLAEADDRCQFYVLDPNSLQALSSDAGLNVVCSAAATRQGKPSDRNVELMFRMPTF
jgi:3',5'-cyclic AMP phosphodiesterase CpdA